LLKRFLRYYLIIISSIFALVISTDYAFLHYQQKNASVEVDIKSVVKLVKEYCSNVSCSLDNKMPFSNIQIVRKQDFGLSAESSALIDENQILTVKSQDNKHIHFVKLDENKLIKIELSINKNDSYFEWYTTSFYLLLGCLFFAVLYPLFRDMYHLKSAAFDFTQSHKLTELKLPKSKYFQPVNDAFKWMISEITKLLALQKELSDTLSHELRTSISRLNFSLATIDKDNVDEIRDILQKDINEIKVLVDEYLSFSKEEHASPNLDVQYQSLIPLIEHHIELLGQYSKKEILFAHKENQAIPIDQRSIARAVKNLIDNAIKYSESKIQITLFLENDYLVFQVDDNGEGLEDTEKDELFLPYTRAAKTEKISGYGLGLAITYKIINWHNGVLIAKQSSLLSGACFQLKLPLHPEPKALPDKQPI